MENRRQPANKGSAPVERPKGFKREGERTIGYAPYQSRDRKFQPRGEGAPRSDRFAPKDDRYPKRPGRFEPRNDRPEPRGRFAPKSKPVPDWNQENRIRIISDLQITDGKLKGKYLKTSSSEKVRPTARRMRDWVFKVLSRRIRARRFLDLGAAAGTIGIEAISRGALIATFVERSSKMCSFIRQNLKEFSIKEGHGEVFEIEIVPFLKRMGKRRRFWDVVYLDPPYDSNYDEILAYIGRGVAVAPGGTLVIQHHSEMFFPEKIGVMKRWRVAIQGDTAISFYERK